jgi:hypothetical protein
MYYLKQKCKQETGHGECKLTIEMETFAVSVTKDNLKTNRDMCKLLFRILELQK